MKQTTQELAALVHAHGAAELFNDDRSYKAKVNAQLNLAGRTHYVDDGTLAWFKARITRCLASHNGLLLGIIESFAGPDGARRYRPVFFDVFGNLHGRPDLDSSFKTQAAAAKAFYATRSALDVVDITRKGLVAKRAALERAVKAIDEVLL